MQVSVDEAKSIRDLVKPSEVPLTQSIASISRPIVYATTPSVDALLAPSQGLRSGHIMELSGPPGAIFGPIGPGGKAWRSLVSNVASSGRGILCVSMIRSETISSVLMPTQQIDTQNMITPTMLKKATEGGSVRKTHALVIDVAL